ncbi:MAG: hypothetical protein DCC71_22865, partial [Proteobacteria bacterium]
MPSPPPDARLAQVALPVPVDSLFSYAVPAALDDAVRPGCRVLVPFGARRMAGLVVARGGPGAERLRAIERLLDPEPVVSEGLIALLVDAARDVYCPVGLALACATPSGSTPRAQPGFALTARGREALARGAVSPALR